MYELADGDKALLVLIVVLVIAGTYAAWLRDTRRWRK